MTHFAIPDELAEKVDTEATQRGCTSDELIRLFVAEGLELSGTELTPKAQAHVMASAEQLRRGEVVDGEVVMARFSETLRRIAAR